jgi:lipoprotein-releasing system permease protein
VTVNAILMAMRAMFNPLTNADTAFSLFSPAYFYLQEVPVKIYFPEALFSFLFAFLSGGFSAYFASKAVSRFHPQEILRYE